MGDLITAEKPLKRIAALVPNVLGFSPGQRVRIEAWAQHLPQFGWTVDFYPFEDEGLHDVFYQPGHYFAKATRLWSCYLRQLRLVSQGPPCDVLFVYREASLIGPALLERLATRFGAPLVYDIDDPVFLPIPSPTSGWFSLLKFPKKTHTLFRLSDTIIAINGIIGEYAAKFNPAVSVIPNCVDIERYRPSPLPPNNEVRLIWTGSRSTMQNLNAIVNPLRRLQSTYGTPLLVIGTGQMELPGVDMEIRQWSAATEVADLQSGDIGLLSVLDVPWNPWKFFLKTVQYMAVGLPVVAQRTGSNVEVIQDGVNGFLVETEDEWYDRLCKLVSDATLRQRMGAAARQTVVERYSLTGNMPLAASVFDGALQHSVGRRPHKMNLSREA